MNICKEIESTNKDLSTNNSLLSTHLNLRHRLRLAPLPTYKVWLYSTNILLILLQTIYLYFLCRLFQQKNIKNFPIYWDEKSLLGNYIIVGIQYFSSFCGILGVYIYSRHLLRFFWFVITSLLSLDIFFAIIIAIKFATLHATFEDHLSNSIKDKFKNNETIEICFDWKEFQEQNFCCLDKPIIDICLNMSFKNNFNETFGNIYSNCNKENTKKELCHYTLLRWIHREVDFLVIIYYFMIYPVKFIIVIALRDDISELFSEIIFTKNRHLYTHWVLDEDITSVDLSNSSFDHSTEENGIIYTGGANLKDTLL
uniref:Tetraspanin n=1 Tax=Strongyloides papillosus TaxID=174720 RepID=A0A0N5BXN3_STREA